LPDAKSKAVFDYPAFLASAGIGRKILHLKPDHLFFAQGDAADAVYFLQKGRAKLTVVSKIGKEVTLMVVSDGDFVGEASMASIASVHLASATAITACNVLKIERAEMIRVMHQEPAFAEMFTEILILRGMRVQADLVDHLFNSCEKRLARILLIMAEFGQPGEPEPVIPKISQEALAAMVGTTRSRVSFFMNRFRKLGFIDYDSRITVHKSLLNVVLHE